MASLLTLAEWKSRTVMPPEDVDALEALHPGWILKRLTVGTSRLEGRLRKRYDAPFAAPVPEIVLGWLDATVTVEAYLKRM